ncbi:hypothetical protein K469DRAFT_714103 [Zopfia rhizophila CBS 207.26]|uniref:Uncharacterized protein n=1 Tax=Zopfia rhizophila CBS 207.26 TaxID=1314779 RepID=A0A6A6DPH5_9PEZI|nr:hypothetical protein K469DRAFT_714103 [Zopfia rhizophila CBS 207.26]
MGAPGFETWTFDFDSMPYTWAFRPIPACLELSSSQSASTPVIARFTYGKVGTKVLPGGEVGHLEIWRDRLTEDAEGIEAVITGCLVVVKYFDNIGRKYRNDGSGGSAAASLINAKGRETTSVRGRIACI